jgi:N-acetylglucosaminyldiphosphoundecaprenol N-acetyl-beta-D-mannosaminyltransferase
MSVTALPTITIRSLRLHAITEAQCIRHVINELAAGRGGVVVTPNLDHLRRLESDPSLGSIYEDANLVVADGMPLVWASRIQGTPLPERVAGSILIYTLSAAAAEQKHSIFLLGGNPGTAERAGKILRERFPGLRIAGSACPPVGFENDPAGLRDLQTELHAANPSIVFVALGSPKQEFLTRKLAPLFPATWFLGVGISFSFVCGQVTRAPLWMQRLGLEWMHRLAQEPKRLARRYLYEGLPFAVSLFQGALRERFLGQRRHPAAIPSRGLPEA